MGKKICCGEDANNCLSIEHSAEISEAVLELIPEDLMFFSYLFTRTGAPDSLDNCNPAQKRLICYKKIFMMVYGIGQTGVKVQMPSCIRRLVDSTYPDA